MTSSKAGKAGWLEEMISGSQGRKLVKSEQFCSIPAPVPESHFLEANHRKSFIFINMTLNRQLRSCSLEFLTSDSYSRMPLVYSQAMLTPKLCTIELARASRQLK